MTSLPLTRTEAFVLSVCQKSFLDLWCYNNPRAKAGKELCDILVVCAPDIIVISVKEISLSETSDPAVAYARWERKAVDASVKQIYGAEGWLSRADKVIRNDGSDGLNLPSVSARRIHRIAVACGDRGQAVAKSADYGEGFVHVMTEQSFNDVLSELDTITDLTDYLMSKEAFGKNSVPLVCEGSESKMLGWYLTHERSFPPTGQGAAAVHFDDSAWDGLQSNPAFQRKKQADRISYGWDRLTDGLSDPNAKPVDGLGPKLNDLELPLRAMARESRFHRRQLGTFAAEFLAAARAKKTRARICRGASGVIYVFVYFDRTDEPRMRSAELAARCYIARLIVGQGDTMVGIGLSSHVPGVGSASDLIYFNYPEWTTDDDREATKLREDSGYFVNTPIQHRHDNEYPDLV